MPLKLRAAGLTDVGRKRKANEDNLYLSPLHGIYSVADGMGGHACGEVASQIAVETLGRFFEETARDRERTWPFKMDKSLSYEENRLSVAVKLSNKLIYERAQKDMRQKGMGTTLVVVSVLDDVAYIAHVGDSRVYRLRQGEFTQMTEDHSLLNDYMKIKPLTPEEIENFPHKNVIVRALGMKHSVEVDLCKVDVEPGDLFLLCSDGLSGLVTDPEMAKIVTNYRSDLDKACQKLIDEANANGGNDNITVMLVEALE
ncbi:MAG: Stp1/IreP family PP2C-type Ser/Thr phosphatase [Deltaproteobacteria bacterium]|nr:MAG: Stp1/IreP family PP2C-type Ser/Thr phosphatase [Deltaproteobacteria bacterium]